MSPRDQLMLDTARQMLDAYRPKQGEPETVVFGVPLSWLDRSDLEAAVTMMGRLQDRLFDRHRSDTKIVMGVTR